MTYKKKKRKKEKRTLRKMEAEGGSFQSKRPGRISEGGSKTQRKEKKKKKPNKASKFMKTYESAFAPQCVCACMCACACRRRAGQPADVSGHTRGPSHYPLGKPFCQRRQPVRPTAGPSVHVHVHVRARTWPLAQFLHGDLTHSLVSHRVQQMNARYRHMAI